MIFVCYLYHLPIKAYRNVHFSLKATWACTLFGNYRNLTLKAFLWTVVIPTSSFIPVLTIFRDRINLRGELRQIWLDFLLWKTFRLIEVWPRSRLPFTIGWIRAFSFFSQPITFIELRAQGLIFWTWPQAHLLFVVEIVLGMIAARDKIKVVPIAEAWTNACCFPLTHLTILAYLALQVEQLRWCLIQAFKRC